MCVKNDKEDFKTIAIGVKTCRLEREIEFNSEYKDKWGFIANRQEVEGKLLRGTWLGIKG